MFDFQVTAYDSYGREIPGFKPITDLDFAVIMAPPVITELCTKNTTAMRVSGHHRHLRKID
jgi:hypothetical protein